MQKYNPKEIEEKWQKAWSEAKINQPNFEEAKNPFFNLMMFPYPSAEGLHIGGMYTFTGVDTFGRFKRMQGYDVFEPIGLDSFGIHSENYAIKIGEHIKDVSVRTEKHFYQQLHQMGNMYDWSRTVETHKPNYYKWTQWLFSQFFKAGLAYRKSALVNFCPTCKTVLSDEQVIDGRCERTGDEVIQKELEQWFFKITDYADRLNANLDHINWDEDVKIGQRNWIGRKEGAHIDFQIKAGVKQSKLKVFTTRPDTIFGATFLVIAPEHPLIEELSSSIMNMPEIEQYKVQAEQKDDLQRTDLNKEKSGIRLEGITAVNPATNVEIPVFVADYVLGNFGTGAIMAVPAHDMRDFEFALKHHLPVIRVLKPENINRSIILKQSVADGFEELLKSKGFVLSHSGNGHLQVEFTNDKTEEFVSIVKPNLSNNFFVDVIGASNMVIFFDKVISTDTIEGESMAVREISQRFPRLAVKSKLSSLMLFQYGDETESSHFYHDILIYEGDGIMLNSGQFSTMPSHEAKPAIMEWLAAIDNGEKAVSFRLRDWVVSRQRYWGPPIPMIFCKDCADKNLSWFNTNESAGNHLTPERIEELAVQMPGWYPDDNLPVELPEISDLKAIIPDGSAKGPLASQPEFVKVNCPHCGNAATRETDVSDPFVDSSWYFLRYPFTEFDQIPFGGKFNEAKSLFKPNIDETQLKAAIARMQKWEPVASYIGGKEHTVLHLLYARFITMVFKDLGYIDFEEPFKRFYGHGLITKDGAKMSKSKGNVINPDEFIAKFGADAVRMYLRFMGPFDQGGDWRDTSMEGMYRFVSKLWKIFNEPVKSTAKDSINETMLHKTIKGVGEDLENLKFNTAVAKTMQFVNWFTDNRANMPEFQQLNLLSNLSLLIAPFMPHLAEEFWAITGHTESVHLQKWPEFDPAKIIEENVVIAIQVNGKLRDTITIEKDAEENLVMEKVGQSEKVQKYIQGLKPKKVVYVKNKIVSIIV